MKIGCKAANTSKKILNPDSFVPLLIKSKFIFENILMNFNFFFFFFQDHLNQDRWSTRFDASNVNKRSSSRNLVGDDIR